MTLWRSTSTAELIAAGQLEIGDGYRAKNAEFGDTGIPFLRIGNLGEGRLLLDHADLYPEENLSKVASKVSRPRDCVIATKATIGRLAYLDESAPRVLYSPQVSFWRVLDDSVLEPRFIRYWLQGKEFKIQAVETKSSTSMADYINLRDQRRMSMTLPPLALQRKITAVLANYDELIENNLRRIEILEEMAQAIYREWLTTQQGFQQVAFGFLADEVKDGVDPRATEPTTPYVGLEHIPRKSFTLVEYGTASSTVSRKWRFVRGDVLFGRLRPYFHKVAVAPFDGVCSTDVIVMRPKARYHELVLQIAFTTEFVDYAVGTSGGTDRPRAKWVDLARFPILLPPPDVLDAFATAVRPMVALATNLARQNTNLRATRDLLLPKLISGAIDVSDLDIDTDWLVA